MDKDLTGEFRWMSRTSTSDFAMETCPTVHSSAEDISKKLETDTDSNSSTATEVSDVVSTRLMETQAR